MKLFLDTANLDEIRAGVELGIVDGVTTNPSLVAKEQCKFKDRVIEICELVQGPVSAEVTALEADGMVEQARELSGWHPHVVVKVPCIPEGLKAIKRLKAEEIRTNCTLVFSVNQALLAAKAGATFVSPFCGRLDDIGHDGMGLVAEMREVYDNYGCDALVLAASLRHASHVKQAMLLGADISTVPYKVFAQMVKHPLTDIGLKLFLADWEKVKDLV